MWRIAFQYPKRVSPQLGLFWFRDKLRLDVALERNQGKPVNNPSSGVSCSSIQNAIPHDLGCFGSEASSILIPRLNASKTNKQMARVMGYCVSALETHFPTTWAVLVLRQVILGRHT